MAYTIYLMGGQDIYSIDDQYIPHLYSKCTVIPIDRGSRTYLVVESLILKNNY